MSIDSSSSWLLKEHNLACSEYTGPFQFALRDFLNELRDHFDYILIDTPSDIGQMASRKLRLLVVPCRGLETQNRERQAGRKVLRKRIWTSAYRVDREA